VLYFGVHRIAPASLELSFRESINASNLSVRITGP
jgi:hypothetical protein